MNLYTVKNDILQIINTIESLKEEKELAIEFKEDNYEEKAKDIDDQIEALENTIASLQWELSDIVEELIKEARNCDAEARNMEFEEKFFARKKKNAIERADYVRELTKYVMECNDERKVEGDLFKVSIVKNGGKRGIYLLCEPKDLPDRFRNEKIEYSLNQDEARKALDSGEEGLKFFYKPQGEHLSVR